MPIRDDVIFGPNPPDGRLTFGDVRKLSQTDQIGALRHRLDAYLISQVNELGRDDEGETKVNSPFPLFLMSLVAIETLGSTLFRPKSGSKEDKQKEGFMEVAKRIDPALSKPLSASEKQEYNRQWSEEERKKVGSKADILYKYGRHTMAHGYRGRGVYITGEDPVGVWRMNQGAIELNPFRFWDEFKRVYQDAWSDFLTEPEPTSPRNRSVREYLDVLLNQ